MERLRMAHKKRWREIKILRKKGKERHRKIKKKEK